MMRAARRARRETSRMLNCGRRAVPALIIAIVMLTIQASALAETIAPLTLETTIPLQDVGGRIDHMAFDRGRQRLLVAALGNDTVEVIDVRAGKRLNRISGLSNPQSIAWSEKADLVLVANAGDGSVRMFRGADLAPVGRIELHDDADNTRIDPRNGNVIVGYGNGGLAIIDPISRAVIGTIPLPGHPEGFQIEPATGRVFVNVPDAHQIVVVDLDKRRQVTSWRVPGLSGNFPMAFDAGKGVVATVFRSPPKLVIMNAETGTVTATLPVPGDADDVFFDAKRGRVYVSCGAGEIAVFQRNGGAFNPLSSVRTSSGGRTSLFVPELDRLFVAERAGMLRTDAAIGVYRPESGS
jgi:DNA-binding beta-propeller fold protein YncE